MDDDTPDDAPRERRTPLALIVSLISGLVALAAAAVGGMFWLLSPAEPDLDADGTSVPPPDVGDGTGGAPDPPENNEADGGDNGAPPEADGEGDSAGSCDEDISCDAPSCEAPTCEPPACDTGTSDCSSSGGAGSLSVSAMSLLPLVAADRLTPKRTIRRRPRVSIPAQCALTAISRYRRWVSPRTRTRCRYVPSCSSYGMSTIRSFGLVDGSRLALRRVRRCQRSVPMGTPDTPP